MALGDFNGDGHADFAAAYGSGISLRFGNGDGTFGIATNYNVLARVVAVHDFNRDGKADLAATGSFDYEYRGFTILLARGDGTFQMVTNSASTFPSFNAVADFNGDGIPDIVMGSTAALGDNLLLFLGKGDGTFRAVSLNARAFTLAASDFDGDGGTDLALADHSGIVSVLSNLGASVSAAATFAAIGEFQAGGYDGLAAGGDFNGDGKPDLAVGDGDPSGKVSVLLSRGDGGFEPAVRYPAGLRSQQVVVGDFNGDEKHDLLTANYGETNSGFSVLLGNGDGTFQSPIHRTPNWGISTLVTRDFNNDNKLDLAIALPHSNSVAILRGNGNGTFQTNVTFYSAVEASSLAVGDFNRDDRLDLAVANGNGANTNQFAFSMLLGKGDGTFQTAVPHVTGAGASSLATGDFNADGRLDLVFHSAAHPTLSVLLGNGDGAFQASGEYNVPPGGLSIAPSIAVGDLNGDGHPDLVVIGDGVLVLSGTRNGAFQTANSYAGRRVHSTVFGDYNGDSKLDFVTIYSTDIAGTPAVLWLNTSCSATPALTIVRSDATLTLSWPFASAGFGLEQTPNLNLHSWNPVDALAVSNNGRWKVTLLSAQPSGFFRLRKPQ